MLTSSLLAMLLNSGVTLSTLSHSTPEPLKDLFGSAYAYLAQHAPYGLVNHVNLASAIALAYWVFYAVLDIPVAVLIAPVWVAYYVLAWLLIERVENGFAIAVGLHIFSWIAQFIGHGVYEGRAPALLDDLLGAVVLAPLFVFIEVLFYFGYAPELQRRVNNESSKLVTQVRTEEAARKRAKAQ